MGGEKDSSSIEKREVPQFARKASRNSQEEGKEGHHEREADR